MDFIDELLASVETLDISEITQKIAELQLTIEQAEGVAEEYNQSVYEDFSSRPRQSRSFLSEAFTARRDIRSAEDEVASTSQELDVTLQSGDRNREMISRTRTKLNILERLRVISNGINDFYLNLELEKYLAGMQGICKAEWGISEFPGVLHRRSVTELKTGILEKKHFLLTHITILFKRLVIQDYEIEYSAIQISDNTNKIEEILQAAYYCTTSVVFLDQFAEILRAQFERLVTSTVQLRILQDEGFKIFEIRVLDQKTKSDYRTVFANIKAFVEFLRNDFSLKMSEELTTLKYVGQQTGEYLSKLLVDECLEDTVPSTQEGLETYDTVVTATKELEQLLKANYIFDDATESIVKWCVNVEYLFISRECKNYMSTCVLMMRRDLHDMEIMGELPNPDDPEINIFPVCAVSKGTINLMKFLEEMLQQALELSNESTIKLFDTVKELIEGYGTYSLNYHLQMLETIPQQIAFYRNNCFYVIFKLVQWNRDYSQKLKDKLQKDDYVTHFNREIKGLEALANDNFETYVKKQLYEIQGLLMESRMPDFTLEDTLDPKVERTIRQCMRQQELLKTVWQKVLPYAVYNLTLGRTLDVVLVYITDNILMYDDIPTSEAKKLTDGLKVIQTRGPRLFTYAHEVGIHSYFWDKFIEMAFILTANLAVIEDRWNDGHGPSAYALKTYEIKKLVRAVFQNTDERAALLSKIP